jgi:hypothetical protein
MGLRASMRNGKPALAAAGIATCSRGAGLEPPNGAL